jgi:hypothetical protein
MEDAEFVQNSTNYDKSAPYYIIGITPYYIIKKKYFITCNRALTCDKLELSRK